MSNMTSSATTTGASSTHAAPLPNAMNPATPAPRHVSRSRRLSTETKSAFKTTEFLAYILTVIAIAVASQTIGSDSGASDSGDYFRADKAFLYVTIVTVGYLLSRGIAKSGSRDFYDDDNR